MISIHALREESDAALLLLTTVAHYFNPRPPRGERHSLSMLFLISSKFQSTPSARRATVPCHVVVLIPTNFNPRPPRGERPDARRHPAVRKEFQSTPSARRATSDLYSNIHALCISIHALREESDRVRLSHRHRSLYFNPRPPRGERQQKQRKNPMLLFHYTHLCTI